MKDEGIVNAVNIYSATTLKQLKNINEAHLNRIVAGALRSTIEAHGPVSKELIGSASKRITNHLLGVLNETNV